MNKKMLFLTLWGIGLFSLTGEARWKGDYLNEIKTDLVSPHQPWAKPCAGGALQLFFMVPRYGAARTVVELYQRLSFSFEAVTTAHPSYLSYENAGNDYWRSYWTYDSPVEGTGQLEKEKELETKLLKDKYNAFIIYNWGALPVKAQYTVLKAVSSGAGLLLYQPPTNVFFNPLPVPAELIQGLSCAGSNSVDKVKTAEKLRQTAGRLIKAYAFGKGKVLGMKSSELLTQEGNYALQCKAILWVSRRQSELAIQTLPLNGVVLNQNELMEKKLSVDITAVSARRNLSMEILILNGDQEELRRADPVTLTAGTNQVSLALSWLSAGPHTCGLRLLSDKGTEDWALFDFEVRGDLVVEKIVMDKPFYADGDTAKANVVLSQALTNECAIRAVLTDSFGRVWRKAETRLQPGAREWNVSLPVRYPLTLMSTLTVEALNADGKVRASHSVPVVTRRIDKNLFPSVLWSWGHIPPPAVFYDEIRKAGFTSVLGMGLAEQCAAHDFENIPYIWRVGVGPAISTNGADLALFNPEIQNKTREKMLQKMETMKKYFPVVTTYSLGDECWFTYDERELSPSQLAAFRNRLKTRYGAIETLNDNWLARFKSFDEVKPLNRKEAIEKTAYAAECDRRSFLEWEYAYHFQFLRNVIHEADPGAPVGAEGSMPGNLEETIRDLEFWGPYAGADPRDDLLLRSIGYDKLRAGWWGGYTGGGRGRGEGAVYLWDLLIRGFNNASEMYMAIGLSAENLFATDYSRAEFLKQWLTELQEIYGGIGQLFRGARFKNYGVAIYHNQTIDHLSSCIPGICLRSEQIGLGRLLDQLGIYGEFVTRAGIEGGRLAKAPALRVLLMPQALSLSEQEVGEISRFVKEGGMIITDYNTGLFNQHGKLLKQGRLDEVFGVVQEQLGTSGVQEFKLAGTWEGQSIRVETISPLGRAIKVTTGTPLMTTTNAVPLCVMNRYGKGRTCYLNFNLATAASAVSATGAGYAFLESLLSLATVKPEYALARRGQENCVIVYSCDGFDLIGIMLGAQDNNQLILAEPRYVVDVRAGKSLGKQSQINLARKNPSKKEAYVFAAFHQPPGELKVRLDKKTARPGDPVQVTMQGSSPRGGVCRVTVFTPDGKEAEAYRGYPIMKQGESRWTIPLAFNDPVGKWKVRVGDVAAGESEEVKFEVE